MIVRGDDDVVLHVEERGEGTPLLLVHGFPHDGTLWRASLAVLADGARCLVPDLRGFGQSAVRELLARVDA